MIEMQHMNKIQMQHMNVIIPPPQAVNDVDPGEGGGIFYIDDTFYIENVLARGVCTCVLEPNAQAHTSRRV